MKSAKKLTIFILAVVLLINAAPLSGFVGLEWNDFKLFSFEAQAASSGSCGRYFGDEVTWALDDSGTLTISGKGNMKDYDYYGYHDGNPPWYNDRSSIKSVVVEDGVINIGRYAFKKCNNLTSITISNRVISIGEGAFCECTSLTSVTIPDSVTSIDYEAFRGCTGLKSITIPDSVTGIGNSAFSGCSSLTSVTIPGGVTGIGNSAFSGCSSLTSVTIPGGVTGIGNSAFSSCSSLTSVTISNGVMGIGEYTFCKCNSLTSITIPESVKIIGKQAFSGCTGLTSITIPNSVTSLGDSVFYKCSGLTSAIIGNSVTSIDQYTFYGCSSLTSITIPDSVTSIGWNAFNGCTGLTSITLGNSVTSIGWNAFNGCTGLTSITLGNSVTNIDASAFAGCTDLTSITIPASVTDIDYHAFYGCNKLSAIYLADIATWCNISFGVDSIPKNAKKMYLNGKLLTDLDIPNGVTEIPEYAFHGCSSITSITIPDSVTNIEGYVFSGCSSLTRITIPDSVTSIGSSAFEYCSSLKSITIPDSVTSIGYYAFDGCSSLKSITIPDSVTSIGDSAFYNCNSLTSITIPDSVTSIGHNAFYNTGYYNNLSNWKNGVLYIGNHLIKADKDSIKASYEIKSGTKCIASYAFYFCKNLTSVTIPNSVTSIGYYAFDGCSSLTSITIPDSVTNIGNGAFEYCSSLTSITIPDSVTSIGSWAFYDTAYYSNSSNWKNDVLYIGNHLIDAKTSIKGSYKIKSGTKCIASEAFRWSGYLTSITIPDSVTSICYEAFDYCSSLKDVYYAGTEEQWKKISISSYNSNLTSANIIYNATPLMTSTETENNQVAATDKKTFKFTVKRRNNDVIEKVSEFIVKSKKGQEAVQSEFTVPLDEIDGSVLTFESSGYKSYVIPSEVYNTFKMPTDELPIIQDGASLYEIPVTVFLNRRTDNDNAYISTVYGRLSDTQTDKNREYKNLTDYKLEIDENDKVDIIISSVGMTNPTYYISQDETHKVSISTGKLSAASLYSKLSFSKDTYVYAVDSDGTTTEPVKIKLVKKVKLSNASQALADSTTYSFLGKSGTMGISINDNMPIFGGSKLDLSAFKIPLGIDIDSEGNVKISFGFDFFTHKYNNDKSEWETKSGWEAFKKSFKSVTETIEKSTEIGDNWYNNWCSLEKLKKQYGNKKVLKTGDPNEDKGFNISFLGYAEGKVVNGDIVFKEGGITIGGNFKYKYSQQVALWAVPGYYYFEASAGVKLSGEVARKIADSNLPVELEATLEIEPGLAVGAGIGIVDFLSVGIRGEGSMPVSYEFVKQHLKVSLKGAIKAEGQAFVFKGEKTLFSGETALIDKTFGIQKRKAAAYINRSYLNALESQTEVSVLPRDYAETTSEWLGGKTKAKRAKSKAIISDGIKFTDLQTSVFESGTPKLVSFGDKKLMAWIEDDSSRDEYNRMRLVYSVYDGATWSEPQAVYDDGHNDISPSLAFDGENVYVAWQKIKRDIVADDANNIDALTNEAEIYLAKYDLENDKFVDVTAVTDNETYDYMPVVAGENGEAVVYFASGDPNSTIGNKIIRYDVRSKSCETSADSLAYVNNLTAAFVDGKDEVSFSVDTDNNLTTTNDISVFTVRDGEKTEFPMPEDHDSAVQLMTYGTFGDETILYTSDGSNVYYVKDGETATAFSTVASINGNFTQCKVGSNEVLFWTGMTETGSEIYMSSLNGETWTDPVKVSDCEELLTNVSIVSDNGTILGVCNKTATTKNESGKYEKGLTDLCSFTFTEFDDLSIKIQSFDETKVVPGEKMTFDVMLSNNGTNKVEQVNITVTDTLGTSDSYVKNIEIASGETVTTEIDYTVPANYSGGKLTVEIAPMSGNDKNDSDNTDSIDIGKCDITISEADVSEVGNTYVITTYIYNNSPISAENVTLNAIAYDESAAPFSQINVGEIKKGECNLAQIEIKSEHIEFDENGTARLYLKAVTDNDANDMDNTSSVIIEKEKENECGHPMSDESVIKAPTCTEKGQKLCVCSLCGEKKYEDIDALGHGYSSKWTIDKKATCTEAGSKSHHCTRCDAKKAVTEIEATGHNFGKWTTTQKATCTDEGSQERTCSVCGHVSTRSLSALGHNYSSDWTTDKKATCTKVGSKSHHCTRCDAKKDVTTIKATGHKYKTTVTTKATTSKNGTKTTKCSVCGYSYKKTIAKISSVKLSSTSYTYDGKVKKPTVTVKDSNGNKLKNGTDYTVKYSSGRKNVGKYTVTVTFKGNYSGTKTLTFKINPKGISVSKLTAGKGKFTATWKKQSTQVSGYQIQYSTSSKMTNAKTKTYSGASKTSASVSGLKSAKTYYVRVRTYKNVTIDGKTVKLYSSWSSVKSVKTK